MTSMPRLAITLWPARACGVIDGELRGVEEEGVRVGDIESFFLFL